MSCGASDVPIRRPVSCSGRNPFGTTTYSQTVAAMVAAVRSRVKAR
jgi:hypothetical protein